MILNQRKLSDKSEIQETIRFLVDGMLGSLSIKLRILGFDSEYDKNSSDNKLLNKAQQDCRILITSDRQLHLTANRLKISSILIIADSDTERLACLLKKLQFTQVDRKRLSRCSICNARLAELTAVDGVGRIVYKCTSCGKIYWKGSHWKKLETLFDDADAILER